MNKALEIAEKLKELNNFGTAPYILCNIAAIELERLDALNAELVEVLESVYTDDTDSESFASFAICATNMEKVRAVLAKAKEQA